MRQKTILHCIASHAAAQPDKAALCEARKSISYGEYWHRIKCTAKALTERGVLRGTHVMLPAKQTIDYLTVFSALQYIGAFPIPLEKSTSPERIAEICRQVDGEFLISDREAEGCRFINAKELIAAAEKCVEAELPLPEADDLSMMMYTTGTTGASKGVVMRHFNDVAIAENVAVGTEMKKNNVEVLPMPLNHSFAIRRYQADMLNGSTVCLMDGLVYIGTLWKMMSKYGVTSLALAPAGLRMIFNLSGDRIAEYASQLDYIQLGSAPLPETDKQKLISLLPDIRMYNIYGSSEAGCSSIVNFNSPDGCAGSIGRPTVNSVIRFTDNDGNLMESTNKEHPGLLAWGGDIVAGGYYNAPDITAETFRDGFVQTRDIAYLDEQGRCILCGRADDVINVGGSKVAPLEVEECAMNYPGVSECACMPIPDNVTGQAPVLFVVEKEGYIKEELAEMLASRLEFYKIPKKIITVSDLPKTFNGKLLRREIENKMEEWLKEN